jgi:hypothetical protein
MPKLINWDLVSVYNIIIIGIILMLWTMGMCLIFGGASVGQLTAQRLA